ncbi:MAG: hypothetical protein M3Q77_03940 [Thermoproteota archaeon]|nr:hypothetical protein [Thermoproteota archaeon]
MELVVSRRHVFKAYYRSIMGNEHPAEKRITIITLNGGEDLSPAKLEFISYRYRYRFCPLHLHGLGLVDPVAYPICGHLWINNSSCGMWLSRQARGLETFYFLCGSFCTFRR